MDDPGLAERDPNVEHVVTEPIVFLTQTQNSCANPRWSTSFDRSPTLSLRENVSDSQLRDRCLKGLTMAKRPMAASPERLSPAIEASLKARFENGDALTREERRQLAHDLRTHRPQFARHFTHPWHWWRCEVNVLVVTDGGLNFGMGGFGLSEFLRTFQQLEAESMTNIRYNLTIAHRGNGLGVAANVHTNPRTVARLSGYKFDSENLAKYDQIWLFGIVSAPGLSQAEVASIDAYVDGGGGLFATGDHGSLGAALCAQINRVKDMRHWADFPSTSNADNEVSMGGARRNDTNRPRASAGETHASHFDRQSDDIPQTIMPRVFSGAVPHPLLSIPAWKRASKIIDIMPDHPHEGQCKPETAFTTPNGTTISTQIVATSTVIGGTTSGGKQACAPHCFPSIAVFDGHPGGVGRIVVDATWHHFVNINLNGVGANPIPAETLAGLTNTDFIAVQHYFMNIARWMTRKKWMLCLRKSLLAGLLLESQLVEATLMNPQFKREEISLADLASIGALSREVLSEWYSPAFALEFHLAILEDVRPELARLLNPWMPTKLRQSLDGDDFHTPWIHHDHLVNAAIGSGFIALRDEFAKERQMSEKFRENVDQQFIAGASRGLDEAFASLQRYMPAMIRAVR